MNLTSPIVRILGAALLALSLVIVPSATEAQEYRGLVGQGWTFMEAGNFRKAEEAFKKAFATQDGKNAAEVYYAIAALWWERRNAMAAWMWLSDAEKASKSSFSWDPGPDSVWDQRIAKRREYIQRHFSAIRLRAPSRGAPLPPLADPPSSDPLLREFTDRLPVVIAEGVEEKVAVQWVLLPNGRYWIGDAIVDLGGGELDASKADAWELPKDGGKTRKNYDARVALIEAGGSPAAEQLAAAENDAAAQAKAREKEAAEAERLAAEEAEREERAAKEREEQERADALARAERAEREERERAEREAQESAEQAERERRDAKERAAREAAEAEKRAAKEAAEAEKRAAKEAAEAEKRAAKEAADAEKRAAKEAADADAVARREAERREAAERERAEATERAEREERERLEEERRQAEWAATEAERKDAELAKEQARLRKEQLRAERAGSASGTDDPFTQRRLLMTGGGGGSSVGKLTDDGSTGEVSWAAQAEIAYVIRVKDAIGLPVGLSWANLPVSGCSHQQTRANGVALHAGPRLAKNLTGRLWLAGRIGGHIGAGFTRPNADARNACATASLEATGVEYGARLSDASGASARFSLADLGWNGWALLVGPDADIGILGAPGQGNTYLGVSFFLRYDQVLPVIRGTAYHFRPEGAAAGSELSSVTLNSISGRASMARFQFGLRGQILF